MKTFLRFLAAWGPLILWAALIFWGSGPPLSAAHTSRFLVPFLRWLIPGITDDGLEIAQMIIRKGGHVTEYAVLTLLFWRAFTKGPGGSAGWRPGRTALAAYAAAILYASSDEFHQTFVPGRQGQFQDVCIDSIGAGAMAGVLYAFARRREDRAGPTP